jgi:hypothetical protein
VKKSRAVPLSLVSTLALAALASGCGSFGRREGWQTCVDRNTNIAVDQLLAVFASIARLRRITR